MKSFVAVVAVAVLLACVCADDDIRFKDKIVLVTGGSSGIGYETALQFAQEGAHVIITARDSNPDFYSGAHAVDMISTDETVKANGGTVRFFKADLTNPDDVKALFDDIVANETKIDIAVNAAGISGPLGKLGDLSDFVSTKFDPIRNNVYALLRSLAEEEYLMVTTNTPGVIINVAAVEGVHPTLTLPLFAASKYATIAIGNSVALEHITADAQPYIRVNNIAPGPTLTPSLFNQAKWFANGQQPWEGDFINASSPVWQESAGNFTGAVPMGRAADPSEIARSILWLCTDDAAFISADTIMADGGVWAF